jgi:intracellular multiplication protein IcmN
LRRLRIGIPGLSAWHVTLLASLLLFGCHRHHSYVPLPDDNFKLPRKVANTSDAQVIAMMNAFKRAGVVKVITIGSDYLISIPSSALFPNQSPRLTWQSYRILNQVVKFMSQFRKVSVNVTGYSSKYVSVRREQSLTFARARAVADYLWLQGIDSRFIFSEGAGSEKPITAMTQGGDNAPNSRIEITFRDAIV